MIAYDPANLRYDTRDGIPCQGLHADGVHDPLTTVVEKASVVAILAVLLCRSCGLNRMYVHMHEHACMLYVCICIYK